MVYHGSKRCELGQHAHSRGSHAFTHTVTSPQLQPCGAKRTLCYWASSAMHAVWGMCYSDQSITGPGVNRQHLIIIIIMDIHRVPSQESLRHLQYHTYARTHTRTHARTHTHTHTHTQTEYQFYTRAFIAEMISQANANYDFTSGKRTACKAGIIF